MEETVEPIAPDTDDVTVRPIDAAVRLGLSLSTVYILIRTGELPSKMVQVPGRQKAQRMVLDSAVREREAKP